MVVQRVRGMARTRPAGMASRPNTPAHLSFPKVPTVGVGWGCGCGRQGRHQHCAQPLRWLGKARVALCDAHNNAPPLSAVVPSVFFIPARTFVPSACAVMRPVSVLSYKSPLPPSSLCLPSPSLNLRIHARPPHPVHTCNQHSVRQSDSHFSALRSRIHNAS